MGCKPADTVFTERGELPGGVSTKGYEPVDGVPTTGSGPTDIVLTGGGLLISERFSRFSGASE